MNKKLFMAGLAMIFSVLLTGCHMKHEWQEATCTQPRTCIVGNETEGEPLGHEWQEADCTKPKTCGVCGEEEGEPLGHEWQEADCTKPKTCRVCGEEEGEVLSHSWQEADCTRPKTCRVCGEEEGEALDHSWQEADYFTPQTCLICEETQGDPLQPSFEAHGLAINARVGETYDYVTCCSADRTMTTVGKLTFSNYRKFESAVDGREGYEWRAVHIEIAFTDENAQNYGMGVRYTMEDYYDTESWGEAYDVEDNARLYTIHYNGTDYTECECMFNGSGFSGWIDGVNTWEADAFVIVPIGYDGMVLAMRNGALTWDEGMYIYDVADADTIFFRMDDNSDSEAEAVPSADASAAEETGTTPDREELEQTASALKEILNQSCQGLVFDDDSIWIVTSNDKIEISIRTYKDYLVPAAAEKVVEAVYAMARRSEIPFGRILAFYADSDDNGMDEDTVVSWETEDMETGTFISMQDDILEELCMIQDMYEYYNEYYEQIEKALSGERVDTE